MCSSMKTLISSNQQLPEKGVSPEWPLDKAQNFLAKAFVPDDSWDCIKENLPGKSLHLVDDASQFSLVSHGLSEPKVLLVR